MLFLANLRSQLAIFTKWRLTLSMKVFLSGCFGGAAVGAGCRATKIVNIIIPKAVINAPIVSPSRVNSSINLSKKSLVTSFIISFIRLN